MFDRPTIGSSAVLLHRMKHDGWKLWKKSEDNCGRYQSWRINPPRRPSYIARWRAVKILIDRGLIIPNPDGSPFWVPAPEQRS